MPQIGWTLSKIVFISQLRPWLSLAVSIFVTVIKKLMIYGFPEKNHANSSKIGSLDSTTPSRILGLYNYARSEPIFFSSISCYTNVSLTTTSPISSRRCQGVTCHSMARLYLLGSNLISDYVTNVDVHQGNGAMLIRTSLNASTGSSFTSIEVVWQALPI
jgi:hypothetical protein